MRNRNRQEEQEEEQGEDETNFGGTEDDDRYRDPNRSINVIDTSNPNYKKKTSSVWEKDTLPENELDELSESYIHKKYFFLKLNLNEIEKDESYSNFNINENDGPISAKLLQDIVVSRNKKDEINGIYYRKEKIFKLKGKKLVYSEDKRVIIKDLINTFKVNFKSAKLEHEKTTDSYIEEQDNFEWDDAELLYQRNESVRNNSIESLENFIDESYSILNQNEEQQRNHVAGLTKNELREFGKFNMEEDIHNKEFINLSQRIK